MVTVDQLCGKVKFDDSKEEVDAASEAKDDESGTSASAKDGQEEVDAASEAKDDESDTSASAKDDASTTKDTKITVKTRRRSGLGVLRWRLAIMLHRFPQLQYYRAHYLARKNAKKPNYWKQQLARDDASTSVVSTPCYVPKPIASLESTAELSLIHI